MGVGIRRVMERIPAEARAGAPTLEVDPEGVSPGGESRQPDGVVLPDGWALGRMHVQATDGWSRDRERRERVPDLVPAASGQIHAGPVLAGVLERIPDGTATELAMDDGLVIVLLGVARGSEFTLEIATPAGPLLKYVEILRAVGETPGRDGERARARDGRALDRVLGHGHREAAGADRGAHRGG